MLYYCLVYKNLKLLSYKLDNSYIMVSKMF